MSASQPERVKSVVPEMIGADISVRRFTLAPGEEVPWHHHRSTDDLCVLLSGSLRVQNRAPEEDRLLAPGEADCSFLLTQGVGKRDFVKIAG